MFTLGHSYPTTPENPSFGKTQGVKEHDIISTRDNEEHGETLSFNACPAHLREATIFSFSNFSV